MRTTPTRSIPTPPEFNVEAHRLAHPENPPCNVPAVANPTILFDTADAPGRHVRITVSVRCDEQDGARQYAAQVEISKDAGATIAKRRHKVVSAKRDGDNNLTVTMALGRVNKRWVVRYRVRADHAECQGEWAPGTSLVPDDATAGWSIWYDPDDPDVPPPVTGLTLDIDQHKAHGEWELPLEAGATDIPDLRIAYVQVDLWEGDPDAGGTLLHKDHYHHGEHKNFRITKPGNSTLFYLRVRTVSSTEKFGAWVKTNATKWTPSTPAAPSVTFTKINKRWRAEVTASTVAGTDAEIARYPIQLVHKAAHSAPAAGDKRHTAHIEGDGTDDDLTTVFRNIPADHYVYVRERARDTQGRFSAWSSWNDAGQPATAEETDVPTGTVAKHGGASTPALWLRCNGDSYATASYADLFAVIGYTYGGAGASFNVPDFRGRHPIGVGTAAALGANEGAAEAARSVAHQHGADSTGATPNSDGTAASPNMDGTSTAPNTDYTDATPGSDSTGATPDSDSTAEAIHTHGAGSLGTGGPSNTQDNISAGGAQSLGSAGHTHNVTGGTGGAGSTHNHGHGHGSHPHTHGHGTHGHYHYHGTHGHTHDHGAHGHTHGHGTHGHGHAHPTQARPHLGVHFIIKT